MKVFLHWKHLSSYLVSLYCSWSFLWASNVSRPLVCSYFNSSITDLHCCSLRITSFIICTSYYRMKKLLENGRLLPHDSILETLYMTVFYYWNWMPSFAPQWLDMPSHTFFFNLKNKKFKSISFSKPSSDIYRHERKPHRAMPPSHQTPQRQRPFLLLKLCHASHLSPGPKLCIQ